MRGLSGVELNHLDVLIEQVDPPRRGVVQDRLKASLYPPRDRIVPKFPKCLKAMDLLEQLLEDCQRLGISPRFLVKADPASIPLKSLLNEAQALWQNARADLALLLLEAAQARGVRHGWIDDHRARALFQLQRRDEAEVIWQQLSVSANEALQKEALVMLSRLDLEKRQQFVFACAEDLAERYGWNLERMTAAQMPSAAFEHSLLEEAIASREGDHAEFSLALMEHALDQGFRSPWLQDNRARALMQLDRAEEASAVWESILKRYGRNGPGAVAEQMFLVSRRKAQQQRHLRMDRERIEQVRHYQLDGDEQAALAELVDGLIDVPDRVVLEEALVELLDQRRQQMDPHWSSLPRWLKDQELALEASELQLAELTRRFGAMPSGALPAALSAGGVLGADDLCVVQAGSQFSEFHWSVSPKAQ